MQWKVQPLGGGSPGGDRQELAQWNVVVPQAWCPRGQVEGRWLVGSSLVNYQLF